MNPYETPKAGVLLSDSIHFKTFIKKDDFILLSFAQTWTNAIPQFLSVTRVPRVRIPLVLIAAYATGLGLFIEMKKVALVSVTRLEQQSAA